MFKESLKMSRPVSLNIYGDYNYLSSLAISSYVDMRHINEVSETIISRIYLWITKTVAIYVTILMINFALSASHGYSPDSSLKAYGFPMWRSTRRTTAADSRCTGWMEYHFARHDLDFDSTQQSFVQAFASSRSDFMIAGNVAYTAYFDG